MGPHTLVALLAEPSRLSVFAAVVLGAGTPDEVVKSTGLSAREVVLAVRRLTDGGLMSLVEGRLVAHVTAFKDTIREYAAAAAAAAPSDPTLPIETTPARAAVLRAFISDGRLVSLPASRGKRLVILEHIVTAFQPGVEYPEREVDAVLRAWHPDYASLRRYLIDEDLMAREGGVYWRTGGPVDLS
jgi:hypothetical protein